MSAKYAVGRRKIDQAIVDLKTQLLHMQETVDYLESTPAVSGPESDRWEILCIHLEWMGACAEELLSRPRELVEQEISQLIH